MSNGCEFFNSIFFSDHRYKNAIVMVASQYPIPVNSYWLKGRNTMFTLLKTKKYSDTFRI